jgi:hypothetical protein
MDVTVLGPKMVSLLKFLSGASIPQSGLVEALSSCPEGRAAGLTANNLPGLEPGCCELCLTWCVGFNGQLRRVGDQSCL